MKSNLYSVLIVILLAAACFSSCHRNARPVAENNIRWDSIHVEKTYHLQDNPENPHCNLQINFLFPVDFKNKEVLDAVCRHILRSCFGESYEHLTPSQAVERYAERYIKEYKSLEADFREDKDHDHDHDHEGSNLSWFSYYEYFSNEIVYSKNNLLCYAVSYENYTGGAHGAHSHTYHILDLNTGRPMVEDDFFIEGFEDKLVAILVRKIAGNNHVTDARELENMGFFDINEIYPNGNFYIDDTGITYCFNEYEIAAYVVGATRVHLPYSEIAHLLRNDSRIAYLTERL